MPTKKGTIRQKVDSEQAGKQVGLPKAGGMLRLMRKALLTLGRESPPDEDPRVALYRQQFEKDPIKFTRQVNEMELDLRRRLEEIKALKRQAPGGGVLTPDRTTERLSNVIDRLLKSQENPDGG